MMPEKNRRECGEPPKDDQAKGFWRKCLAVVVGITNDLTATGSGAGTVSAGRPITRLRVLIVDEDCSYTRLLKESLDQSGRYEVLVEPRSPEAAQTARIFQPQVVLLNPVLPNMFGGDVVDQFKADPVLKYIPIILLAYRMRIRTSSIRNGKLGAYPVFLKTTTPSQAMAIIENHTSRWDVS